MFLETYRMTGTSNDDKGKGLNPADDQTPKDDTSTRIIGAMTGVKAAAIPSGSGGH